MPEQEREENYAESENIPYAARLSPGSETEQQSDGSVIDLQGREEEDVVNEDSGLDLENNVLCSSPTVQTQTELRRSTREKRPKKFLTYKTLGEPTMHSHANTNSITAYTIHNTNTFTHTPP